MNIAKLTGSLRSKLADFLDYRKEDEKKNAWVKRFEYFLCKKYETLNEFEKRYDELLDNLKRYGIRMSNAEKISKFADALPSEWDKFLIELNKDSRFSNFYPSEFIKELKTHNYENNKKKKDLIKEIQKNLDKISLDVVLEISRRIKICFEAKYVMKYDFKRGTFKTDSTSKNEESEKKHVDNAHQEKSKQDESTELSQNGEVKELSASTNETSSSESVCSDCEKSTFENVKLLRDVESTFKTDSTSKNEESEKKLVDNVHQEKSNQDDSTELSQNGEVKELSASTNETSTSESVCSDCEKSAFENVKLLRDVESTFKTDSTSKNEESEKKHVDNAHQEKSKQDDSTELSQNGEVKELSASTNETSSSESSLIFRYSKMSNDREEYDAWWRRDYARWEIRKLYEPFHEAQRAKRWNEDERVFNTKRLSDNSYLPDLMNKLKEVFEASLPKVVEMRKRKEEELKKMIEEVKADAKIAAEKEQKSEEKEKGEEKEGEEEKAVVDQKVKKEDSVLKETEIRKSSDSLNVDLVVEKENKC
ncbi:kinesin-like protein KIF20B [Helianthus annuus]|uniref:kinesin-like protein KIF20B n=1 Tax=Helianthus annuus TaxID=4232 RepID=UPI001653000C|nr:kinesin-like protein KIF20B [Helianthus annuus]